jgi:hypothetical protein
VGTQRRQAGGELRGSSGRVGEHQGIATELVDVQAAPDSGRSRLSTWRPSVAATQRGIGVGGAAQRSLASEDGSGRSPVLARTSRRRRPAGSRSESASRWRCVRRTCRQLFLAMLLHKKLKSAHTGGGGARGVGARALGTVVRHIGGGHGKRSEACGIVESLVRYREGDVASPSRGRVEDKTVG